MTLRDTCIINKEYYLVYKSCYILKEKCYHKIYLEYYLQLLILNDICNKKVYLLMDEVPIKENEFLLKQKVSNKT